MRLTEQQERDLEVVRPELEEYMKNGIPGCGDACDCITG